MAACYNVDPARPGPCPPRRSPSDSPAGRSSMSRARRAGTRSLPFALVLVIVLAALASGARRPDPTAPSRTAGVALAAVTWPTSTLVVSEVQTGGASASAEFAEIHNAAAGPVDLAGLEVAYVTSSGSTVTRKASWTVSTILDPGRHLL